MQFLRLSPASEKKENNLKGELEFLCYLQNQSYPAVIPVISNSGELIVTLDTIRGKYYASVFKGVDGISIEDTDYNDHILFAYGKALGQLHILSTEYSRKTENGHTTMCCYGLRKCWKEEYFNEPDWMVTLRERLHCKIELLESGVVG